MRQSSFNVVHLAVALLCVVVFVTIAIALGEANRRTGPRVMQANTQLRGIHQGLVTYANSNKNWYPGINELGEDDGIMIEERYQTLIEDDYFTPEYAISPSETEAITEWDTDAGHPITAKNYSFAMLQVPEPENGRRHEWSQTLNSQAIVVSDRNIGSQANPTSIHADRGEPWRGSVLWNDNHVEFANEDTLETKYGSGELNETDRLFDADSAFDALLIHTGN